MTGIGWNSLLGVGVLIGLVAAGQGQDGLFQAHGWVVVILCGIALGYRLTRDAGPKTSDNDVYFDGVVRAGVIATIFWGMAGFLAGLAIASQLAFPSLNLGWEYTSFGRLRPLHTSAVIFAFGGNALIATSFYVVQRTCRARLALGDTAWFVFWGYQLFIVLAATGYLLGVTQSKEYAEPE